MSESEETLHQEGSGPGEEMTSKRQEKPADLQQNKHASAWAESTFTVCFAVVRFMLYPERNDGFSILGILSPDC
jgi:hypothetical protein